MVWANREFAIHARFLAKHALARLLTDNVGPFYIIFRPTMEKRLIDAVIFDVDGTLVDSVDLHAQAWHESFAHYGIDTDLLKVRNQIGKGSDELMPVFLSDYQLATMAEDIKTFRTDLFRSKYMASVRGFPKVRDLFLRLLDDGKQLSLASSAKDEELEHYKRVANIADLQMAQSSADDVERAKPHPDIFEAALKKLGSAAPERCVVVGDTPYDAEAAGKAGLRCVGMLCGGFAAADLRRAGCSILYQDPALLLLAFSAEGDRAFGEI